MILACLIVLKISSLENLRIARVIKENEIVVSCGSWETKEVYRGSCWGDLKKRDDLEDLGIEEKII